MNRLRLLKPGAARLLASVLLSVLGLALAWYILPAQAQEPIQNQGVQAWSSGGPYGGVIYDVVIDSVSPTVAYVAAPKVGVFGTQNGGQSWSLLKYDSDSGCGSNVCLATHPTLPGTVFFVRDGSDGELYRSDNYGLSWTAIKNSGASIRGNVLVLDLSNPNRMFMGMSDGKVLVSLNGGTTWSEYTIGGLSGKHVMALALDPVVTSTLYAGSREGGGVYISTNSGQTWAPTAGQPEVDDTWSLAVCPTDRRVYHGTWYGPLSYSPDQGQNWYTMTVDADPSYHNWIAIHCHPTLSKTLFVGNVTYINRTDDGGLTWQGLADNAGWNFAIHPIQTNTMYAVGGGVQVSTDDGHTWQTRQHGITAIWPEKIAVAPNDHEHLLVGVWMELPGYHSIDGGKNWTELDIGAWLGLYHAIAFDLVSPSIVYAGHIGSDIIKSENGGLTWSKVGELPFDDLPSSIDELGVQDMVVHPATHTLIYAGVELIDKSAECSQQGGLYKSEDSGSHWEYIQTSPPISVVNTMLIAPTPPYTMYLATGGMAHCLAQSNGVFRSVDGGQTWTACNDGLPGLNMSSLLMYADHPNELFSAPWEQGTYRDGFGVYHSVDGGDTWREINTGLNDRRVEDMAYDPNDTSTLFAATWGGLFVSYNKGQNWSRWPDAMGQVSVLAVATAPLSDTESVVYVGTIGGAVTTNQSQGLAAADSPQTIIPAGIHSQLIKWRSLKYLPIIMKH